jgi:hypothetical protein
MTVNADGTYTIKGSGWYWCRIGQDKKTILEYAPGMAGQKSLRLFLSNAKLTIEQLRDPLELGAKTASLESGLI